MNDTFLFWSAENLSLIYTLSLSNQQHAQIKVLQGISSITQNQYLTSFPAWLQI